LVGNQPMSFAVPAAKHAPIVVDQMLAAERLDVLRNAGRTGAELPSGVIVDADGAPTTYGRKYVEGGAVLPMGRHRGGSLALVFELLTGVLAGGRMLNQVGGATPSDKAGNSLFLMALDPGAFFPQNDEFAARVDKFAELVGSATPAPGVERVRVPGDERSELARRRRREGIPYSAEDVAKLRGLAAELGVAWPSERR
jgi:LDH2 family malate/lactate/ureidoglycolate dehydrogenase